MSLASELAALRSQQTASARAAGVGRLNRANTLLPAQLDPRVRPSSGQTRSRFDQARNTTRTAGATLSDVINAQRALQAAQERAQRAAGMTGGSSSIPRNIGLPQTIEGLGSFSGIPRDPTVLPAVFQQPGALQAAEERAQRAAQMYAAQQQAQMQQAAPVGNPFLPRDIGLGNAPPGFTGPRGELTQPFSGVNLSPMPVGNLPQRDIGLGNRPPQFGVGFGGTPETGYTTPFTPRDIGFGNRPPQFGNPNFGLFGQPPLSNAMTQFRGNMGFPASNPYAQGLGQFAGGQLGQQPNMGQFNNMNANQGMGQSLGSMGSQAFGGQFNNMQPQMGMQQQQFAQQGPPPGFSNSFSYAPL